MDPNVFEPQNRQLTPNLLGELEWPVAVHNARVWYHQARYNRIPIANKSIGDGDQEYASWTQDSVGLSNASNHIKIR